MQSDHVGWKIVSTSLYELQRLRESTKLTCKISMIQGLGLLVISLSCPPEASIKLLIEYLTPAVFDRESNFIRGIE